MDLFSNTSREWKDTEEAKCYRNIIKGLNKISFLYTIQAVCFTLIATAGFTYVAYNMYQMTKILFS